MANENMPMTTQSITLKQLGHSPLTACASCPNAVWMQTRPGKIQVFCMVMRVLIDSEIRVCDGQGMTRE